MYVLQLVNVKRKKKYYSQIFVLFFRWDRAFLDLSFQGIQEIYQRQRTSKQFDKFNLEYRCSKFVLLEIIHGKENQKENKLFVLEQGFYMHEIDVKDDLLQIDQMIDSNTCYIVEDDCLVQVGKCGDGDKIKLMVYQIKGLGK